jgi:hypothetical protein
VPRIQRRLAVAATSMAILAWSATGPTMWASAAARSDAGTTPVTGVAALNDIACPSSRTCVAVGLNEQVNGKSAIIAAATGKVRPWPGKLKALALEAVACPDKSRCLTVADDAVASVSTSTGAMKVTAVPKAPANGIMAIGGIACAGSGNCYAVGYQGTGAKQQAIVVHLSAAGKLLKVMIDSGNGISAIACPTSKLCLLAKHSGDKQTIQLLASGRFAASRSFPANTFIQQIACYQAKICFALGGTFTGQGLANELFPLSPKTGAIGHAVAMGSFNGNGMACASSTRCLVVGFISSGTTTKPGLVTVAGGKAGHPATFGPPGDGFSSIGCATASACYAAGLSRTGAVIAKT